VRGYNPIRPEQHTDGDSAETLFWASGLLTNTQSAEDHSYIPFRSVPS
jgi:hypothetical protein